MKSLMRIAFASALLMMTPVLSGCGTLEAAGTISTAISRPVSEISPAAKAAMNAAKKGLTAAHQAHGAAADFLLSMAQNGSLRGQNAATAKKWLDASEVALVAADKLVAVGDASGIMAKIGQAHGFLAQVEGLFGK